MKSCIISFVLLASGLSRADQVRVMVEWIEVPHKTLTQLMSEPTTADNDTRLRKRLAELIHQGDARIMETMMSTHIPTHYPHTESVQEIIYPTEYETAYPKDHKEDANLQKEDKQFVAAPTPAFFDMRRMGSCFEYETVLRENGKWIDVYLNPEISSHTGTRTWAEWQNSHGKTPIQTPLFHTMRLNTQVRLSHGKPMLAAVLSPKNPDGQTDFTRKLMLFVRADLLSDTGNP